MQVNNSSDKPIRLYGFAVSDEKYKFKTRIKVNDEIIKLPYADRFGYVTSGYISSKIYFQSSEYLTYKTNFAINPLQKEIPAGHAVLISESLQSILFMYQDNLSFTKGDEIRLQFSTELAYDRNGVSEFLLESEWFEVDAKLFDSLFSE